MQFTKKEHRIFNAKSYEYFILGGDIGGTNSTLGIFGVGKRLPALLVSFHFRSRELNGLHYAVNEVLHHAEKDYKIRIGGACFAIAGALSQNKDSGRITNAGWSVSKKELFKKTKLKKIMLINDFEAVGHGINMLAKKDLLPIKKAKRIRKAPVLVIGAGTGLGKTVLIYDGQRKSYMTIPSEAGHSDFPAQNPQESELVEFVKRHKKIRQVSYEQVVSGQGLENIYLFLRKSRKFMETAQTAEIDRSKDKPGIISRYRKTDETCREAFAMFREAYAKCAKNFALDSLAFGGVYIAGGIAPKNAEIFDSAFVRAFEQNYKMVDVLKKIPIYLVMNLDAGLLGAGFAGAVMLK